MYSVCQCDVSRVLFATPPRGSYEFEVNIDLVTNRGTCSLSSVGEGGEVVENNLSRCFSGAPKGTPTRDGGGVGIGGCNFFLPYRPKKKGTPWTQRDATAVDEIVAPRTVARARRA